MPVLFDHLREHVGPAPDARSFIMGLTPEESLAVLGQRAEALLDRVSQFDNELASFGS